MAINVGKNTQRKNGMCLQTAKATHKAQAHAHKTPPITKNVHRKLHENRLHCFSVQMNLIKADKESH